MNLHNIRAWLPWSWLSCIVLFTAVSTASAQSYNFVSLGSLGGTAVANGINDFGQIVGNAALSAAAGGQQYAVTWNGTIPTTPAQ